MHYNTIRPQYLLQTNPISFNENTENHSEIPLSFTAQSQLSCDESIITPPDMVADGNIISSPDIHITIPPETNNAVLSQENTNLTFQEILQSIRKERSTNMEDFHEIHKSIIEQSRANNDDNEDEEYDEENNWYIDDAYKRKLKRIQEMKKRRTEH
jgi:hypothetical protein